MIQENGMTFHLYRSLHRWFAAELLLLQGNNQGTINETVTLLLGSMNRDLNQSIAGYLLFDHGYLNSRMPPFQKENFFSTILL